MGMPEVNYCCCGCSLRSGSVFIGFLCGIAALSSIISLSLYAQNLKVYYSYEEYYVRDYSIAIIQAIFSALMMLTCVYLVKGAIQNNPSYVRPWITINSVLLTIHAVLYAVVFIMLLVVGEEIGIVLGYLLSYLVVFGVAFYFLVVVNSFYRTLLPQSAAVLHSLPPPHSPPPRGDQCPPAYPYPPAYSLPRVQVVPLRAGQAGLFAAAATPPAYSATHVTHVQGLVVVPPFAATASDADTIHAKY